MAKSAITFDICGLLTITAIDKKTKSAYELDETISKVISEYQRLCNETGDINITERIILSLVKSGFSIDFLQRRKLNRLVMDWGRVKQVAVTKKHVQSRDVVWEYFRYHIDRFMPNKRRVVVGRRDVNGHYLYVHTSGAIDYDAGRSFFHQKQSAKEYFEDHDRLPETRKLPSVGPMIRVVEYQKGGFSVKYRPYCKDFYEPVSMNYYVPQK